MEKQRTYIAVDLKSFYASVECIQRELDTMTTNLVVADQSRTENDNDASLIGTVADDVPLELDAEQRQVNAGEAEVPGAKKREGAGQEGQMEIFEHSDQVADQNKQTALPNPLCQLGMACNETSPLVCDCFHNISTPLEE